METTITSQKPNLVTSEKRPFIKVNTLLPLQIIKHIPNDDLSEVYLKTRVFSFLGWSLLFMLLTFILVQFGGVDKTNAIYIAISCGIAYFSLRLAMASEEANKLLSEEVEAKLSRVDKFQAIEESHSIESERLQQEILQSRQNVIKVNMLLDDAYQKCKTLESKCTSLQTKNDNQLTKLEELEYQMKSMDDEIKFLNNSLMKNKVDAYELGSAHTKELIAIERSTAQKLGEEKRAALEKRLEEIENERKEALGV